MTEHHVNVYSEDGQSLIKMKMLIHPVRSMRAQEMIIEFFQVKDKFEVFVKNSKIYI